MTEYIYVQGDSMYVERYIKERVERSTNKRHIYIHIHARPHIYMTMYIYTIVAVLLIGWDQIGANTNGLRVAP